MSYKLNTLAISPGGLNLLEPSDTPPQNESLDLTDFWPGASGKLEQAPQPLNIYAPGVALDGVMRTGPSTYCAGSGNVYLKEAGLGPIDTGYGIDYPTGMISFQGYAWFISQSKQAKHNGSTLSAWTLPAPTTAPTVADIGGPGGGFIAGDILTYYITWVVAGGGETNPSPPAVTSAILADFSSVSITRPTPPTGVTGWNVYREVNGIPYLMNYFMSPIDVSVSFIVDSGAPPSDDTGLLDFGQIMEANHDAAPAAAIMANQTYNGRIVVGNSVAHPNRIWWTQPFEPAYFRGAASENGGDWVDVGTDNKDEVRAIVVRPGMLVIYRAKSIWRHMGDLGDVNADLEPACLDVGLAGPRAVASTAAGDYFASTGGDALYRFNNDWPLKLSQKIEPLLRGLPAPDANFSQQNTTQAKLCAVGHYRGRLYLSYTPLGAPEASFILHLESGRWFACSQLYRAFQDAGDSLLAGSVDGLFAVENAYSNTATALAFQSQYLDCGLPDHEKTFADLVVTRNTQGQNLTVTIRTNKNANPPNDSFDIGVFLNSSVLDKQIVPLLYPPSYPVVAKRSTPIKAFNLSVRITGSGFTTPQVIDSPILLHYYVEARRGKTFDTGPTNHGLEGVGMIDQVELDIDTSSGAATMRIASDIPGGVMADWAGAVAIPQTTGRQVLRIQPTSPVYGRLFREQIGSSTDFQLYGYKVRILPIGVYLDGSNPVNEFWYTGALAPGD